MFSYFLLIETINFSSDIVNTHNVEKKVFRFQPFKKKAFLLKRENVRKGLSL